MKIDLNTVNIVLIFWLAKCVTVEKHIFLLRVRKNGTLLMKKMSNEIVMMRCKSRISVGTSTMSV